MAKKNIVQGCDAGECKRVEDALRRSKIMLEKAQELGHLGSWDWDIATNEVFWSDEVYRIYGLDVKKDKITYKTITDTLAPGSRDAFLKAIDGALKLRKSFDMEYSILSSDGTQKYIHTKGEVSRDKKGDPARMFGMVQDITGRKRAEEELKEAVAKVQDEKNKFESIIAALGDPVSIQGTDFKILYQNKIHKKATGEQEGKYCYEAYEHNSSVCTGCPLALSFKDGKIHNEERKVGELYIDIVSSPLKDSTGKIIAGIEVARNITEHRRAEEKLRDTKNYLDTVIQSSCDCIFVTNKEGRFEFGNQASYDLIGYTKDEIIGQYFMKVIHPDYQALVMERWIELQRGEGRSYETDVVRKDGAVRSLSVSHASMNLDGERKYCVVAKDITERKKTEEALKKSKIMFEKAQDLGDMGSWDWDGATKEIVWSDGIYKIYGLDPKKDKIDYKRVVDTLMPECKNDFLKGIDNAFKKGKIFDGEYGIVCQDGTRKYTRTKGEVIRDKNGKPVRMLGVVQDITEYKKVENLARHLSNVLKAVNDIDRLILREHDEKRLLEEACKILLQTREYVLAWVGFVEGGGKKVVPVASAGDVGYLDEIVVTCDEENETSFGPTGTAIRTRQVQVCRDMAADPNFGPWRKAALRRGFASSAVAPVFFRDRIFGAISVYSNKTDFFDDVEKNLLADLASDLAFALHNIEMDAERKNMERAALELKERDEAILSSIVDAVFAIDKNGTIMLFNKMAEELAGVPGKNAIGRHFKQVVSFAGEKDGKPNYDFIDEINIKSETTKINSHGILVRKDMVKIPVAYAASPVKTISGEVIGIVVIFRDVTREQEIDKAKIEFVSLASHQLRTPLSVVNWYTEMLLSGDLGELSKKQKKYMKEVYKGSQRMGGLVNALLNVSRLEFDTFVIEPRPINIVKLARSVIREQKLRIKAKKIKLTESYAKNLPLFGADPKLLRMVFQNLLSNAVKYTPPKGSVAFEIGLSGPDIVFKISDNGYGIPKEQQSKIFLKFFRADNIREKETEGTGLGLYIAKSIVDYSGGKIWFESRTKEQSSSAGKQGTIFYVTLPLAGMRKKDGIKALA